MSYRKHYDIISRDKTSLPLCDEYCSIQYGDIPGIMEDIDLIFTVGRQKDIACLGVLMENSIAHAMLVLYLLSEKINFFLLAADSPVHNSMPPFCSWICTIDRPSPANTSDSSIAARIRIEPNPLHNGQASDIHPGDALAFFSSSGTSGTPKYICFKQSRLIANADNCRIRFGFDHHTKILVPVPVSHMYGMGVGLLPALLAGSGLCLIEKNNVIKLIGLTKTFLPDFVLLTPTVIRMLLRLGKPLCPKTRYITAGEKISSPVYQDFETAYGPLFNLYGCTELGAIATSPDTPTDGQLRSSGILQPLPPVRLRIDGEDMGQILCRHNAGFETYIDSLGKIIATTANVEGWLPTNDLGMMTGHNSVRLLGRMDNCVNRSGFLVSLDEIATLLETKFTGITQAVVFECEDDSSLTTRLIAICQQTDNGSIDNDTMKKTCRQFMHRHQIPDEFHFVPDLPRLSNGKPDRKYLVSHYKDIINKKQTT